MLTGLCPAWRVVSTSIWWARIQALVYLYVDALSNSIKNVAELLVQQLSFSQNFNKEELFLCAQETAKMDYFLWRCTFRITGVNTWDTLYHAALVDAVVYEHWKWCLRQQVEKNFREEEIKCQKCLGQCNSIERVCMRKLELELQNIEYQT